MSSTPSSPSSSVGNGASSSESFSLSPVKENAFGTPSTPFFQPSPDSGANSKPKSKISSARKAQLLSAKLKKASEGEEEVEETRINKVGEENTNQSFQFKPEGEITSSSFIDMSQEFSFGSGDSNSSQERRKVLAKHYAKKPAVPVVVTTDSNGNVLTINGNTVAKNTVVASSVASKVVTKVAETKSEEKSDKKAENSSKKEEKPNTMAHPMPVDPNRFHGDSGLPSSSKRSKRKKDQAFSNTIDQEDTGGYTEPDTNIDGSLVVPHDSRRSGIPHQKLTDPAAIEARRKQVAESVARATAAQNHAHILHTHLSHSHHSNASRTQTSTNSSTTKKAPTKSSSPPTSTGGVGPTKLSNLTNTLGIKAKVTTSRRVGNSRQIAAYQASRDSLRLAEARRKMTLEKTNKKNREAWEEKEREERQKIKEFWLGLSDAQRKELVRLEKEAVLKKMKEQQKHTCSCSVCGRRRTVIEEELEMLYDAYYEELENFEGQNSTNSSASSSGKKILSSSFLGPFHKDDGESSESESFSFAKSLTVKGGILTVADDLLKNEGKKFLEMMEKLAERRMRKEDEEAEDGEYERDDNEGEHDHENENENDDEEETDEEYPEDGSSVFDDQDDNDDDDEGRRMFQMFAAKMFEQRVLTAYREKVAYENQKKLLEDLEKEKRAEREKQEAIIQKQKEKQEQARLKKIQNEELKQRQRKEQEELQKKQEEEKRKKLEEEKQRKLEEQKKQKELQEQKRLLEEEEQRKKIEQKKEERRKRKEEEKLKKQQEETLKQLESVSLEDQENEQEVSEESSDTSSVTSSEPDTSSVNSSSSSKKKKGKKKKKPQQSLPQNRYVAPPAQTLKSSSNSSVKPVPSATPAVKQSNVDIVKETVSVAPSSQMVQPPTVGIVQKPQRAKKEEDDDEDMASLLNHLLPSGLDDEEPQVKATKNGNSQTGRIEVSVQKPTPIVPYNSFNPSNSVPVVKQVSPLPWSDPVESTMQPPISPRRDSNSSIQNYLGVSQPPMQGMMPNPMALWGSPAPLSDPMMGQRYPVYPSYASLGGSSAWGTPQPSIPLGVPVDWQNRPSVNSPLQPGGWKFLPNATNIGSAVQPPVQQIHPPISSKQNVAPNPHAAPFVPASMK